VTHFPWDIDHRKQVKKPANRNAGKHKKEVLDEPNEQD
jgi:hypothetical protein